jgi:hypothetical protein
MLLDRFAHHAAFSALSMTTGASTPLPWVLKKPVKVF